MWPTQRVIEASRADGGHDSPSVIVVPDQAKLSEIERNKIRDVHSDYHDRYGYI